MQEKKIEQIDKKSVRLCCGGKCPTVTKTEKGYILKDDFGGIVFLTNDEFNLLLKVKDYL